MNAVMLRMARKSPVRKATKKRRGLRKRSSRSAADIRTEQALLHLARNVKRNSPVIRQKLREAGMDPNPSLVFATAMYFDALDRLAKE